AEARAHILEGLLIALDHIDEVIATIRSSQTDEIARNALMQKFGLSEKQAVAILDMRLRRLTGLEREKIEEEYKELLALIEDLKAILASEARQRQIIKDELEDMKKKYGDPRRSEITIDTSDLDVEDLIADEEMVITLTKQGYIKRMNANVYRNQHKGGAGVIGMKTKEDDYVTQIMHVRTHNTLLFFTSTGRTYRLKAYEVPEAGSRNSRGTAMVNVLPLAVGESVTTMIDLERIHENVNLFMVTEFGVVKRTAIEEYRNIRRSGLNAINLDDGDRLISVIVTTGNQDGDVVVGAGVLESDESEAQVFTISEEGYGKRNEADAYNVQKRGGIGTKNFRINDKTGDVVAVEVVHNDDEVMLISEQGKIIRFNMNDIAVKKGKAISGVKTQNLDDGDKVASIAVIPASEIESED
ncbi:MAG: DNA gyrase subunit A, partial [Veillonella sp.]|uniref:DNA gyrase C-terminal beta-propeller domain-containing protein n=1 Tax=Veillonella sp. TaxID=1926307 RepID=UPI00257C6538